VVPIDPDHPLPQSDADVIAANPSRQTPSGALSPSTVQTPGALAGLEDEDLELQAALHASLDGDKGRSPSHVGSSTVAIGAGPSTYDASIDFPPTSMFASPPPIPPSSSRPAGQPMANPVAASMARNQAMLERMRREQEFALREHYQDEVSRFDDRVDRTPSAPGLGVEDDDEQLRRAIAESEAMAREQGHLDSEVAEPGADLESAQDREWSHGLLQGSRVYDDENAELQAALQASLQGASPPEIYPSNTPPHASPVRHSSFTAASSVALPRVDHQYGTLERDDDDLAADDSGSDTATEETKSDALPQPQGEDLSIEEMRRRRLARFGGPTT
jgi:Ataxin-3